MALKYCICNVATPKSCDVCPKMEHVKPDIIVNCPSWVYNPRFKQISAYKRFLFRAEQKPHLRLV